MKINLLFIACILLFGSCARNIQVVQVESSSVERFEEDVFATENEALAIAYDFWIEGGVTAFNITNKTDQTVIIDFTESTFRINDQVLYYYQDLYRYYDVSDRSVDLQKMEIAPKATETIEGFPITYQWKPVKKTNPTFYVPENSPIQFVNKLVYTFADDLGKENEFENEFWVSSIEKLKRKEFKALTRNNLPKSDKFYVRRDDLDTIDGTSFWINVGIEVLAFVLFFSN